LDPSNDLDAALQFVIERIKGQAVQSGAALTHVQLELLRNLPKAHSAGVPSAGDSGFTPARDTNYERLCALAKAAFGEASEQDSERLKWEFASAVFLFHNDPMWSVLYYAGVKNQRPGWDFVLLVFWAALLIAVLMAIVFALDLYSEHWIAMKWGVLCLTVIAMGFLTRWGVRRTERRRFEHEIERCRAGFNPTRDKTH
jgi:hypothetical protein